MLRFMGHIIILKWIESLRLKRFTGAPVQELYDEADVDKYGIY